MSGIISEKGTIPKRNEMVSIIKRHIKPVQRAEYLPCVNTCGRVCAEDVYSKNTLPNYPTSRFDGIAVRYADFMKGEPDTGGWLLGREYEYCNTGIAMPEGYDTVIAIEDVTIHDTGIEVHELPEYRGEMVNEIGSNMLAGERLISKGTVVVPAHIGLLISGGIDRVNVYAKPRVAIIPTGDELVPPTDSVPIGKNVESNSYMIAAYLDTWGAEAIVMPVVRDDPAAIADALNQALAENDAVTIIAGSSLGTKDFTISTLNELGELIVPELAHGPGRKSSLSIVDGKPVMGIAGPPLGAQITCDLYLAPFVSALRGLPNIEMQKITVISDDDFKEHDVDFCERVHIYKAKEGYRMLSAFALKTTRSQMQALSNGNFYRKAGTSYKKGELATVELLCPVEYIPEGGRAAQPGFV